jgi:hypothetical protein
MNRLIIGLVLWAGLLMPDHAATETVSIQYTAHVHIEELKESRNKRADILSTHVRSEELPGGWLRIHLKVDKN